MVMISRNQKNQNGTGYRQIQQALSLNNIEKDLLQPIQKISKEISDFDEENQNKWFMPDEYKDIDLGVLFRQMS